MSYEVINKINNDINLRRFLRENSNWYKYLNRSSVSLDDFISEMKIKYKLTTSDKINRTIDNISMIQSFLDILK